MTLFKITARFLSNNFALLILGVYLITGSMILPDYGISTDEPIQRKHGIISFDYINQKFNIFPSITPTYDETLPDYEYRNYGVVFQVFCYGIERLLRLDEALSVFLLRHILTFLFFWISAFYFLKTIKLFFHSKWIQVLGLIFYILSPRIFVEAFYNSKDIMLLSWISIGTYTMIKFIESGSQKYLFSHALVCSLAINARIVGIVLPFATVLYGILLYKDLGIKVCVSTLGIRFLSWGTLSISLTILFWPLLWEAPIQNFLNSFNDMKRFQWDGQVLLWGKINSASDLPWHYTLSEILVTTPLLYSILFLIGFVLVVKMVIKRRFLNYINNSERLSFVILILFIIPCISVIYFHSTLYNGWRQMYFIYPSFLILALIGLTELIRIIKSSSNKIFECVSKFFLGSLLLLSLSSTVQFLVTMHPYQYIYFNNLAGKDPLKNFDGDYFGLSYKNALQYLITQASEDTIKIKTSTSSGIINQVNFLYKDINRLLYVEDIQKADYYLTTYYFPSSSNEYEQYKAGKGPYMHELIFSKKYRHSKFVGIYKLNNK